MCVSETFLLCNQLLFVHLLSILEPECVSFIIRIYSLPCKLDESLILGQINILVVFSCILGNEGVLCSDMSDAICSFTH